MNPTGSDTDRPDDGEITHLLGRLRAGDAEAFDRLVPLLYDDLRRIARQRMRGERDGHTLNTTALVNEAYIRLLGSQSLRAGDRSQFFAAASETMRRILVDYARSRNRLKRGLGKVPVPLDDAEDLLSERQADEMLALEDALVRLAGIDARACRVVQYRFFGGLSLAETAEVLAVSVKTVQRAWAAARAWLRKEVARDLGLELP